MNVRASAARVLFQVAIRGRSLSDCLLEESRHFKDERDQALLQALCFGACRWYFQLDAIAQQLLEKPLKEKDLDIYMLILIGLYQLKDMRIPDYAAVAETVAAVKIFKKIWAKGLVNGVLRQYQRCAEDAHQQLDKIAWYSHPRWMIEKLQQAYPAHWQAILNANNSAPPLVLRVNQQQISRENYEEKLRAANIDYQIIPETQQGITLSKAMNVEQIPGFDEGMVSIQDGGAQLAAELLELQSNLRVLDACAAPGGKTAHMLEIQPTLECIAIDVDAERVKLINENLHRLHLSAKPMTADAGEPNCWWDGQLFDRILLDAPCSASGVIRRHPDIKLLRREADIAKLAQTQLHLLQVLWPLLKKGGILLYVTCSIFPEENGFVLKQFLQKNDAAVDIILPSCGIESDIGKQILPGMYGMDGFYFARLRK